MFNCFLAIRSQNTMEEKVDSTSRRLQTLETELQRREREMEEMDRQKGHLQKDLTLIKNNVKGEYLGYFLFIFLDLIPTFNIISIMGGLCFILILCNKSAFPSFSRMFSIFQKHIQKFEHHLLSTLYQTIPCLKTPWKKRSMQEFLHFHHFPQFS